MRVKLSALLVRKLTSSFDYSEPSLATAIRPPVANLKDTMIALSRCNSLSKSGPHVAPMIDRCLRIAPGLVAHREHLSLILSFFVSNETNIISYRGSFSSNTSRVSLVLSRLTRYSTNRVFVVTSYVISTLLSDRAL